MAYTLKIDESWGESTAAFVVTQGNGMVFVPLFTDAVAAWLFANYFSKHYAYSIEDYNDSRQMEIARKANELLDELFGEDRKKKVEGPGDPDWEESEFKESDGKWAYPTAERDYIRIMVDGKKFAHYELADVVQHLGAIDGKNMRPVTSAHDAARAEWLFDKFVETLKSKAA